MAKRCVELSSHTPDFHHLLSSTWGFLDKHSNGLRAVERAIELLPNQPDWLYDRATHIRLRDDEVAKVKNIYTVDAAEAYLKFLSSNPMDQRKYPEACYCLSQIYLLSGEIGKAKVYYQKGLEAEDPEVRLPCFDPVKDDFPPKLFSKRLLKV